MPEFVSPGVYSKIVDLSTYLQSVPGTIGCVVIVSERGPDNEFIFTNSKDFYLDFGEPNISYLGALGKTYGMGPYIADQFLKTSDSLYVIRVMPTGNEVKADGSPAVPATYANIAYLLNKDILADTDYIDPVDRFSPYLPQRVVVYGGNVNGSDLVDTSYTGNQYLTVDGTNILSCLRLRNIIVSFKNLSDDNTATFNGNYNTSLLGLGVITAALNDTSVINIPTDTDKAEKGLLVYFDTDKKEYVKHKIYVDSSKKLYVELVENSIPEEIGTVDITVTDSIVTVGATLVKSSSVEEFFDKVTNSPKKYINWNSLDVVYSVKKNQNEDYCCCLVKSPKVVSDVRTYDSSKPSVLVIFKDAPYGGDVTSESKLSFGLLESLYNYIKGLTQAYFDVQTESNDNFLRFIITPVWGINTGKEVLSVIADNNVQYDPDTGYAILNEQNPTHDGVIIIRGVGRGEWYNGFKIRITPSRVAMKAKEGIYNLDIYQKQKAMELDPITNTWVEQFEIVQTFEVSFDPDKVDGSGESIFIADVLNKYFRYLRAEGNKESIRQLFRYIDKMKSMISGVPVTVINRIKTSDTQYTLYSFELKKKVDLSATVDCWTSVFSDNPILPSDKAGPIRLGAGSDGDLMDPVVLKQLLVRAYTGKLNKVGVTDPELQFAVNPLYVDEIINTEDYYFSIVFDAGYPTEVKDAIVELARVLRRDCVAILDNLDNNSVADALLKRNYVHTYNTYHAALYECYTKVYDMYTGRDIWVPPTYHMARIIPYNDLISEIWYAPAGFNRASIDGIKSMRFNPNQADRDNLYLNQINPIVKFNTGFVVWGQLTTQRRPSAMQDLNIARLVLYIKRAVERFCRYFIFEMNTPQTWEQVAQAISGFLEDIKMRGGLMNYSVSAGATEYEIKTKQMHVDIILEPTRVIEKINLTFFIK